MEQSALIDSRAEESLTDQNLAKQLQFDLQVLPKPSQACALDSHLLSQIAYQTHLIYT